MQKCRLGLMLFAGLAVAADIPVVSVHDFGKVPPGGQWTHVFAFTNLSSRPLQVKSVDRTCSCVVVEDVSSSVAPGKAGTVAVRLYTASARGPLAESVTLRFSDPASAEMRFSVIALVQAPVEAIPDFVSLSRKPTDRTNAFTYVEITNHLAMAMRLTNAISMSDRFATKLEVVKPGRSYRLRIEAIPPFNSGHTFGTILVNTSLLEFPRLEVTAFVPAEK